jgi:hypothetical protein
MSSFTEPLDFDCVGAGIYKTRHPFLFYLSDDRTGDYVEVPACFVSNGASIPKSLQALFGWRPMDIRWAQAAFLHDGLVGETGTQLPIYNASGAKRYASWSEAATWFDKALQVKRANSQSCPPLNRKLFVMGVRLWGVVRRR